MSAYAYPARRTPAAANWRVAPFALAAIGAWAVYAAPGARHAATEALRPLIRAFAPDAPPVKFGDVRARRMEINGQTVLYVEGALVNAEARARKAPSVTLAILGDDGRPLYTWTAKPVRPELAASGDVAFQTRLLAPPEKFKSIAITLKDG